MTENWITANLQAAISFFNSMMTFMYDILTINPITYRGGTIWGVVNNIYEALLGVSISLMVIFIYLGMIEDVGEMIKHKNYGAFIWTFIKIMFASGILLYGRYLLVLIFFMGKEITDKIVLKNGVDVFSTLTWVSLPDSVTNATNGLTTSTGIVFWIVTLLGALVIMVVCFSIMLTVYGRLFKIYMHIAIAPLPLACFASRTTVQYFMSYIKSFVSVLLEGVVIIVACMIFSAFANGFDVSNPMEETVQEQTESEVPEGYTEEDVQIMMQLLQCTREEAIAEINREEAMNSSDTKAANAEEIWLYIGEMLFLYIMLAGIIKGADDFMKRMTGV